MGSKMDDLDENLLALLGENARLPVAKLAASLGVARATVQTRIDRLEASGVIAGYTVRRGSAARARRIHATALVTLEPRALPSVIQRLKSIRYVSRAHTTSGRFDLILSLVAETTEDLDKTLDQIGALPGVRGSESLIHLSTRIDRAV